MKTKTKQAIWAVILTLGLILFFATGCGSKKISSQSEIKENTEFELKDNSIHTSKVEQETQYINTDISERIVTLYGVRFDTIEVAGKPFIIPIYYPEQKIEDRNINTENFIWRLNTRDSIQNAVTLEFKRTLEKKDKKITELIESTIIYQIALLIISIIGITLLVLYIRLKVMMKKY